jgi:hypothetical protein
VLELEEEGHENQGQQCVELRKPPARAYLSPNRSKRELVLPIRLDRYCHEGTSDIHSGPTAGEVAAGGRQTSQGVAQGCDWSIT